MEKKLFFGNTHINELFENARASPKKLVVDLENFLGGMKNYPVSCGNYFKKIILIHQGINLETMVFSQFMEVYFL